MPMKKFEGKHAEISELILGAFYKVHRVLGYGFSEKVYVNALAIELRKLNLPFTQQQEIDVYYDGERVGVYFADLVVNTVVMLEIKAVSKLLDEHEAQLLNYLKATYIEVGLLLNFGPAAEIKRRVYDNDRKGSLTWIGPDSRQDTDFADDTEMNQSNRNEPSQDG